MKDTAYVCSHPHLTEWFVATSASYLVPWYRMKCTESDHTFIHSTAVYVYHLCIKNTFSEIFQYLLYSIKYVLNNNSGDRVVAL